MCWHHEKHSAKTYNSNKSKWLNRYSDTCIVFCALVCRKQLNEILALVIAGSNKDSLLMGRQQLGLCYALFDQVYRY